MNKLFLLIPVIFAIMMTPVLADDSFMSIIVAPLNSTGYLNSNWTVPYEFNFTNQSDCSEVIFSHSESLTTDRYGRANTTINITDITYAPSYICEYQNSTLRAVHKWETRGLYENIITDNFTMTGLFNTTGNVSASYFIGDGSLLTGIVASIFNISADQWLYFNYPTNTKGLRYNSTGNKFEFINSTVYVPNLISANYVDAELGYFNYLQMGYKGYSTGNPFTIINTTGTQKLSIDFDGDITFLDDGENNYITWNESGLGVWNYGTFHALEFWAGFDLIDVIRMYSPTEFWEDVVIQDGKIIYLDTAMDEYLYFSPTNIGAIYMSHNVSVPNDSGYCFDDPINGDCMLYNNTSDVITFTDNISAPNLQAGISDHNLLNNLNWSVAGHVMDDDLVFDTGKGIFLDNAMTNGLLYNLTAGGEMQWFGGEIHFMNTHLHLDDGYTVSLGNDGDFDFGYDAGSNITQWVDSNERPAWFVYDLTVGDNDTSDDGVLYMDGLNMGKWLRYNFTSGRFEFNDELKVIGELWSYNHYPLTTETYDLGNNTYRWNNTNTKNIFVGNSTGNTTITPDGRTMYGTARKMKSSWVNAYNMYSYASTYNGISCTASTLSILNATWIVRANADGSGANVCDAQTATIELPEDYEDGTPIQVAIDWSASPTTGAVFWGVGMYHVGTGETYVVEGTYNTTTATTSGTSYGKTNTILTFDGTGIQASDDLGIVIYRHGDAVGDTLVGNALIHMVEVYYTSNKDGSSSLP